MKTILLTILLVSTIGCGTMNYHIKDSEWRFMQGPDETVPTPTLEACEL